MLDHSYPMYSSEGDEYKDDFYLFDGFPFQGILDADNCTTGYNCYSGHPAIDYAVPGGVPVRAASSGILVLCIEPWGALFTQHEDGLITTYLHMNPLEIPNGIPCADVDDVQPSVNQGQVIGYVSNKNAGNNPNYPVHLHFGVGIEANINEQQNKDPFGWWSLDPDPWSQHSNGFVSSWLWKGDEAGDGDLTVDNVESQAQLFYPYNW